MGERFKHINTNTAWFIVSKSYAKHFSVTDDGTILISYQSFQALKNIKGETIPPTFVYTYFNEDTHIYEYTLTLYEVLNHFYPEYLKPENQNLPHEWVWRLYYEETL